MIAILLVFGCQRCPDKQVAEPHTPVLCPDLYDDDKIVDVRIEIAPEEWAGLIEEYETWEQRLRQRLDLKPYHPIARFEAEGQVIEDAQIRLKGNPCCSWEGDKMQFVIAFNKVDPDGRFMGLRKIALDAPPYDPSVMRERIALSYFRDTGIASSCANHARLSVNGEYYGLYTNIEFVDQEFLQRQFPCRHRDRRRGRRRRPPTTHSHPQAGHQHGQGQAGPQAAPTTAGTTQTRDGRCGNVGHGKEGATIRP